MKIERRGLVEWMSFEDFMEIYGLTLVITGRCNDRLYYYATIEYNYIQFYKAKMDGSKLEDLMGTGDTEENAIKNLVRQLDCNCIAARAFRIVVPKLRSG